MDAAITIKEHTNGEGECGDEQEKKYAKNGGGQGSIDVDKSHDEQKAHHKEVEVVGAFGVGSASAPSSDIFFALCT